MRKILLSLFYTDKNLLELVFFRGLKYQITQLINSINAANYLYY